MSIPTPQPQTTACQFTALENGIWKFTFTQATNHAVDEWYMWQTFLKTNQPPRLDKRVMMLLDVRKSGPLPLLYSLQQAREWRKKYPDLYQFHIYVVFLLKHVNRFQEPYIKLIKDGVNIFTMDQVAAEVFFDEEQKAIDWLLNA